MSGKGRIWLALVPNAEWQPLKFCEIANSIVVNPEGVPMHSRHPSVTVSSAGLVARFCG